MVLLIRHMNIWIHMAVAHSWEHSTATGSVITWRTFHILSWLWTTPLKSWYVSAHSRAWGNWLDRAVIIVWVWTNDMMMIKREKHVRYSSNKCMVNVRYSSKKRAGRTSQDIPSKGPHAVHCWVVQQGLSWLPWALHARVFVCLELHKSNEKLMIPRGRRQMFNSAQLNRWCNQYHPITSLDTRPNVHLHTFAWFSQFAHSTLAAGWTMERAFVY